jgi:hypothetical protein
MIYENLETRWIEAWNDLYEIVGDRWQVNCLLPDGTIIDIEDCLGWLQESAYLDFHLKVEEGWVIGKRGVIVKRSMDSSLLEAECD